MSEVSFYGSSSALALWNAELKARKQHRGCAIEELCDVVFPAIRVGQFSYPPHVCVSFINDFSSERFDFGSLTQGVNLKLYRGEEMLEVSLESMVKIHDFVVPYRTPAGEFVLTPGRLLPIESSMREGDMVLEVCRCDGSHFGLPFSSIELEGVEL